MNKIDCAENRNLSETLARLPSILPYCSQPVTIAFVYARYGPVIPLERSKSSLRLSRKLAFGERVGR